MSEKRFTVFKSKITGLYVVNDTLHEFNFEGVEKASTLLKLTGLLNTVLDENEQLRKELASFEEVNFTNNCDGSSTVLYMKKEE